MLNDVPQTMTLTVTWARFLPKKKKIVRDQQRDAKEKIMGEANITKKIIYPGYGNELEFTPGSKVFH
jgi:hypothetical protein